MAIIRTGKFKTIPEQQEEIQRTICDLCGGEIPTNPLIGSSVDVEVSRRVNHFDGHDGSMESEDYDICSYCFQTKLVPFIKCGNID